MEPGRQFGKLNIKTEVKAAKAANGVVQSTRSKRRLKKGDSVSVDRDANNKMRHNEQELRTRIAADTVQDVNDPQGAHWGHPVSGDALARLKAGKPGAYQKAINAKED